MSRQPQRLDLTLEIKWKSGWHVGSGLADAAIDRLQRRRVCQTSAKPIAFVPGSQIKGVLRHHCERLAAMLGSDVSSPHVVGGDPRAEVLDNFRPLRLSRLLIDRLFGSRFEGECLFVDDAVPEGPHDQVTNAQSRTSIDRVTGTAREKTLFVTEVVSSHGPQLKSILRARHRAGVLTQLADDFPFEYALLVAGVLSLDAFGGSKSTGLGNCRLMIPSGVVRWNNASLTVEEALRSLEETDWHEMVELVRSEETP